MAVHIKSPEQIEQIRLSCQLAAKSLKFIEPYIVPGVTTERLDHLCAIFIQEHGGIPAALNYNNFPKSICTSINEEVCHGIPSSNILKDGDIIKIDIATILNGYFGDTCATFAVGQISDRSKKLMKITKNALKKGIEATGPNKFIGDIGYAICTYAQAYNYSVVREYVGHGVGLEFHEEPQIPHYGFLNTGEIMLPGMIFTIEPMLCEGSPNVILDQTDNWTVRTADKKRSAQYEHTVLITEDGYEILTEIRTLSELVHS